MENIKFKYVNVISVLIAAICLFSCSNAEKRVVTDGLVQGTYYHIVFYAQDTANVKQDIKKIFDGIDSSLSLWEENSTVSRVNRNEDVLLDDIFIDNFNAAIKFSQLTEGAFDITV